MPQKSAGLFIDSYVLEAAYSRTHIGISIGDPISRRLVEGVAAQLGLATVFLEEAELAHPEHLAGLELLIADEACALRFLQAAGLFEDPRKGIRPAVVAAVDGENPKGVLPCV